LTHDNRVEESIKLLYFRTKYTSGLNVIQDKMCFRTKCTSGHPSLWAKAKLAYKFRMAYTRLIPIPMAYSVL
jgi:hypothetical protein